MRFFAVAFMALSIVTSASAADQLVLGKKLLIKNPPSGTTNNKVVHLSKDTNITVGPAGSAGDPQCSGAGGGGASSLRILAAGGAGDVVIPLPCAGWTTNGTNTLYKYKDTTNATCTIVLVKNGVLAKAICKGSQVAIDLNSSMSPVAVVTTLNSQQYCTDFGGTVVKDGGDDKTFLRKDAPLPVSCPTTTTTTAETSTTSTTATSSTTTTTANPCSCVADRCDPDYPALTNVCTLPGDFSNCTDDAQCASGTICVGPHGSPDLCGSVSGCWTPCPGGCGGDCP